MTIDQMNEIAEWLSPLDDYSAFNYTLQAEGLGWAEVVINGPDGHICDLGFYANDSIIEVVNVSESTTNITYTSVWEQICLRIL